MSIPYEHLRFALAHLEHARTQLNKARQLTIDQDYDSEWTLAIDTALAHNEETDRQVANISMNIRSAAFRRDERQKEE